MQTRSFNHVVYTNTICRLVHVKTTILPNQYLQEMKEAKPSHRSIFYRKFAVHTAVLSSQHWHCAVICSSACSLRLRGYEHAVMGEGVPNVKLLYYTPSIFLLLLLSVGRIQSRSCFALQQCYRIESRPRALCPKTSPRDCLRVRNHWRRGLHHDPRDIDSVANLHV